MSIVFQKLRDAQRTIIAIEHLLDSTLPRTKDHKMILRIIPKLKKSVIELISAVIQYEFIVGNINISNNKSKNLKAFDELSTKYGIVKKELETIKEIILLNEKINSSLMNFKRNEKIVIFSDKSIETIDEFRLRHYISVLKSVIEKIQGIIINRGKI